MKKCLAMFLSFLCATSFADTITLLADEWCPYNCAPNAANPGYMIEVAKLAFESKGHKVEYKLMNWERSLQMVKEGKATAAVGADKTELEGGIYPTESLGDTINAFFVPVASSWKYTGPESLKGQKVGVIKGYPYEENIENFFKSNPGAADYVSGDNATETNIKKLNASRITTYLENIAVFNNQAKEMGLEGKFKNVGATSTEATPIYLAFSPALATSQAYAKMLSDKIVELRASGELKKILAKYGLTDWK